MSNEGPGELNSSPEGAAQRATNRPADRGRGKPVWIAVLAVGMLCLVAACGGSSKPTAAASSPSATPSASPTSATPSTPAAAPSTSTGSDTSSGTVTADPASASDVSQFTSAANSRHICSFKSSADTLTSAKVTNNGWGIATVTAKNPQDQGNAQVIFKRDGSDWSAADCGSDFTGDDIPQSVLTALNE
jgi:hypothetical protein